MGFTMSIKLGMTQKEVLDILGEPSNKTKSRWYYEKFELFWWIPNRKYGDT
jgi:hypothetical protein